MGIKVSYSLGLEPGGEDHPGRSGFEQIGETVFVPDIPLLTSLVP